MSLEPELALVPPPLRRVRRRALRRIGRDEGGGPRARNRP